MARTAIRARLLDFVGDPANSAAAVRLIDDGLLLVEGDTIVARGDYAPMARALAEDERVIDYSGCLLLPGFIDAHAHVAQIDAIAAPAEGLFEWLQLSAYPAEARFSDPAVCREAAGFFLDELAWHGTTSACVLGSVHPESVEALFAEARSRKMRLVAGKCLMDRNCPDALRDDGDRGIQQTMDLAERWHGRDRLSYAITPRFAGSSSERQLKLAGELAQARPDLYVQSHLAETRDEVRWIAKLFPKARSYLDVYDGAGLVRQRSIFAHCIWLDSQDRQRMTELGALAAVCPTSNLFLRSGAFDFGAALRDGLRLALATDIGGGQSPSMLATMRAARDVAGLNGAALQATQLFYWATRGAADALGWEGRVGVLEPGAEADFVVLDPAATPLLARRTAAANSVEALLFALMTLGDDRAVRETFIAGQPSKARRSSSGDDARDAKARARELARRFPGRLGFA